VSVGFQTPQYKLAKLLEQARNGVIQLPDFQRGYKWDEERIRSLLVTVMLGHPLGVVMLLQAGNDQVRFKPKPIEGTPPTAAEAAPDLLLLDGQQRLTSLYQAMSGDGVVDTEDSRKKKVQRRFYIDIAKAINDPGRRDEAVVHVPGDGKRLTNFGREVELDVSTPERERQAGYFPFRLVYDQPGLLDWLWKYPPTRRLPGGRGRPASPSAGTRPGHAAAAVGGVWACQPGLQHRLALERSSRGPVHGFRLNDPGWLRPHQAMP
jgi:hypothetical protein